MADGYYPFLDDTKLEQQNADSALPGVIHHAPAFAHVEMVLAQGAVVLADGGSMIWKDANLNMETVVGDCWPACWRRFAGESCCQNKFTGPGKVAFSFKLPGDMKSFAVTKSDAWRLAAGAFICGTNNLRVSTCFAGCFACACGGEEAWLTTVEIAEDADDEAGIFYAGGYGAITRHEVADGHTLAMSSGCFFATGKDVGFVLRMPGGCWTCCWGGEGLVMAIEGPTVVYTQNRNPAIWKTILRREGAKNKKGNSLAAGLEGA